MQKRSGGEMWVFAVNTQETEPGSSSAASSSGTTSVGGAAAGRASGSAVHDDGVCRLPVICTPGGIGSVCVGRRRRQWTATERPTTPAAATGAATRIAWAVVHHSRATMRPQSWLERTTAARKMASATVGAMARLTIR